jgi:phosphoribosylaminoimidazolecarboxamide formyltransferase/IMP cyclohydrolase
MTALISVSDKTDIIEFASALHALGVTIISTGGTAAAIEGAGIPVTKVSDVTGFPEILDGRVKTLHPKIHGGLLGVPNNPTHAQQMAEQGIESIHIAVINLYPFEQTVVRADAGEAEIIENIDIGGPAMVRAAAKNFEHTCVVVNSKHYGAIIEHLRTSGSVPLPFRKQLALEAFSHTAQYDARIGRYFADLLDQPFPDETAIPLRIDQPLRYGENPHQQAALYGNFSKVFRQLHGKELSYNNIIDIDAAAKLTAEFAEPTVAIIKHTNPCGVGSGTSLTDAWEKAFATDSVSPFGGIICLNREVDVAFADLVHAMFTEVIIAPAFTPDALDRLMKKKDRRLISVSVEALRTASQLEFKSVAGSFLAQQPDMALLDPESLRVVTTRQPTDAERASMMFAWTVAKHVKSNAIVYALADRTLAIGAGQMSRVDSARIAVHKAQDAGLDLLGCAVASDAFFPFADGLLQAAEAGATAVIQPGGSVRDDEVIAAANDKGLTMMFTGMRHFRH